MDAGAKMVWHPLPESGREQKREGARERAERERADEGGTERFDIWRRFLDAGAEMVWHSLCKRWRVQETERQKDTETIQTQRCMPYVPRVLNVTGTSMECDGKTWILM